MNERETIVWTGRVIRDVYPDHNAGPFYRRLFMIVEVDGIECEGSRLALHCKDGFRDVRHGDVIEYETKFSFERLYWNQHISPWEVSDEYRNLSAEKDGREEQDFYNSAQEEWDKLQTSSIPCNGHEITANGDCLAYEPRRTNIGKF